MSDRCTGIQGRRYTIEVAALHCINSERNPMSRTLFGKRGRAILGACVMGAVFASAQMSERETTALGPDAECGRIATAMVRAMTRNHQLYSSADKTISSRTWSNYVSALDPERVYFQASDIEQLSVEQTRLGKALSRGDTQFAFDVFTVFRNRVRERVRYVNRVLDSGMDFRKKGFYRPDRKAAAWPVDAKTQDELWRRKIKNEWLEVMAAELTDRELAALQGEDGTILQPPVEPSSLRGRYEGLLRDVEQRDAAWVLEKYLTAFARAFDPNSDYMSQRDREDFDVGMVLSFAGVGAVLAEGGGEVRIAEILPGGSADRSGKVKPGDRLMAVGEAGEQLVDVRDMSARDIVFLVRGKVGSRVVLELVSASGGAGAAARRIELVREDVPFPERAVTGKVLKVSGAGGRSLRLGVVTVPEFFGPDPNSRDVSSSDCVDELRAVLAQVDSAHLDGLLLDFRDNWGGYMHWGVEMTGLFMSGGAVGRMVDKRGRSRIVRDPDRQIEYAGPLVVLVNRFSGSEPEVLAGTLQDYGRAVIVGDSQTYGKGTAQILLLLGRSGELGSVKVTTLTYYRVSGSAQQLKGVEPDIVIPSESEFAQFGEKYLAYPIEWSESKRIRYERIADLGPTIELLRSKSNGRMATPQFAAYTDLLNRLHASDRRAKLPLNLDGRLAIIRQERELQHQMAALAAKCASADQGAETDWDPVLDESMKILADLVDLGD